MEDPQKPQDAPKPGLTYEETPIIEPIVEVSPVSPSHAPVPVSPPPPPAPAPTPATAQPHEQPFMPGIPHPKKKSSAGKVIGNILFFVLLFGLGMWLSTQLRPFFSDQQEQAATQPTPYVLPTDAPIVTASSSASGPVGWTTYSVVSGASQQSIGVTYQLPPTIAAPRCDNTNCSSSGTDLPGGTRFTVAARGKGYALPDFRGAILTDANGKQFVMKQTILGGKGVYEYRGDFTGRTGGGYTFTAMRGVLLAVTDTTSVEFNHFAPTGKTTDFAADDALLDQIIGTMNVGTTNILPTSLPSATGGATPASASGY